MEGDLQKRLRLLEVTDYGPGGRAEQIWAEVIGTEDEAQVKRTLIQKCKFQAPDEAKRFTRALEGRDGDSADEPEDLDLPGWKIAEMESRPAGYVEEPETVEREPIDPSFYSESELRQTVQYDELAGWYMADFVREAQERGQVPKVFSDFQTAALRRAKELDIQPEIRSLLVQARNKLVANAKAKARELKKAAKVADATAQSQIVAAAAAATVGGGQNGTTKITMPKGPDGQPSYQQLRCDGYIVGDRGIIAYGEKSPIEVSLVPIIPIAQTYSKSERGRACVELAWPAYMPGDDGKPVKAWRTITVDRSTVASDTELAKVLSAAQYPVSAKTKKELSHYITTLLAENGDRIPMKWTSPSLGWTDENWTALLPYDADVHLDMTPEQISYGTAKIPRALMSVKGNPDEWLAKMREIRSSGRRDILAAFATVAAAPLVGPLGLNGFIVDIVAKTGMGKTVFAMTAASFMGNPDVGKYVKQWLDSKRAIEITAGLLRNFCLILDDTKARHGSLQSNAAMEAIVYSIAGKGTSSLGTATGDVKSGEEFRLLGLSTSEESNELSRFCHSGGSKGRVLSIPQEGPIISAPRGQVNSKLNELVQWLEGCHGHGIRPWVEVIKKIGFDELRERYGEWNTKVAQKYGKKASKQGDAFALLLLVDELLEKHIFQDGARMDIDSIGELLMDDVDLDENIRAYNLIREKVASDPFRFQESESVTELDALLKKLRTDYAKIEKKLFGEAELKKRMTETIANISKLAMREIRIPNQTQWGFPVKNDRHYMNFYPVGLKYLLLDAGFGADGFLRWAQKNGLLYMEQGRALRNTTHLGLTTAVYTLDVSITDISTYLNDPDAYRAKQRETEGFILTESADGVEEVQQVFAETGAVEAPSDAKTA